MISLTTISTMQDGKKSACRSWPSASHFASLRPRGSSVIEDGSPMESDGRRVIIRVG